VNTARWGGFIVRKEKWTLSLTAKILVAVLVMMLALTGQRVINRFLAVTDRVHSDILVVEGWIDSYVMNQAACEFKRGNYRQLILVRGFDTDDYQTERSRNQLVNHGVPPDLIQVVNSSAVRKDRTYHLALAVKGWLAGNAMTVSALDVVTLGPHARRSRLMFEKAFGKSVKVGIIALDDFAYDPQHWWRSSEGVREVVGEVIAYLYARFYFVWT
jgi:hypothetical protein